MGELCALWCVMMCLLVSGQISCRHATLTLASSQKDLDMLHDHDQVNSWHQYFDWLCFTCLFYCWFDISRVAVQYACSLHGCPPQLPQMLFCPT
jgi:hypothetical protein